MDDDIKLHNGFFEVTIKPDAFGLGVYFANLDSGEQARFLKGFVSEFESVKEAPWAFQCSYIADELNSCSANKADSFYKNLIKSYIQDLLEHLE